MKKSNAFKERELYLTDCGFFEKAINGGKYLLSGIGVIYFMLSSPTALPKNIINTPAKYEKAATIYDEHMHTITFS